MRTSRDAIQQLTLPLVRTPNLVLHPPPPGRERGNQLNGSQSRLVLRCAETPRCDRLVVGEFIVLGYVRPDISVEQFSSLVSFRFCLVRQLSLFPLWFPPGFNAERPGQVPVAEGVRQAFH